MVDCRASECAWLCNVPNGSCLKPVHTSNNVEATFDFVVVYSNNVERVFLEISMSKQIEHVQFVSTLSNERATNSTAPHWSTGPSSTGIYPCTCRI